MSETAAWARSFVDFCDGIEAAGLPEYARRGRLLARQLIESEEALAAERSARKAMQAEAERLREILLRQGGRRP